MKLIATLFLSFLFSEIKLGENLGSLTLKDFKGEQIDLQGRAVIFEWTNFKCPYVRKHYDSNNMQNLQSKAIAEGFIWVTVLSSAPGKEGYLNQGEVQKELSLNNWKGSYFILDPDGELGKKFGAKTTPHMFVSDHKGNLVYKGAIDSIKSTKQADISKAENYVLKVVEGLKLGALNPFETKPYGCSVKYKGWW